MQKLPEHLQARLDESSAYQLMLDFQEKVSLFPAAHIECKSPKRESAVLKGCEPLYPYHTAFYTPTGEYGSSVILIANEMAVPHMIKEVAIFAHHLEQFYSVIKKVNNIQELQTYYKQFTLKPKALLDALIEDVKLYADRYAFEADIKSLVESYKEQKQMNWSIK